MTYWTRHEKKQPNKKKAAKKAEASFTGKTGACKLSSPF